MDSLLYDAVLFDLGGVVFDGPLTRFTEYERSAGLPDGLIRRINSTNPDSNAWARAERGELTPEQFLAEFAADARALGHEIDPGAVADAIYGDIHPPMVRALHGLKRAGLRLAAVTNNMSPLASAPAQLRAVLELFDVIVESSVEGVRKPEEGFYRLALDRLGVPAPRCVYLDDLGINLKPARALGMTTIKVVDIDEAVAELERHTGLVLSLIDY